MKIFFRFLLLGLAVLLQRDYFIMLQTLNRENWKTKKKKQVW